MPTLLRPALIIALLGVAACDEVAVANDPVARAELRATKSCIAAVENETGVSGATINTTIPIIELNQYIVNVPNAPYWTCTTNDQGQALTITQNQRG
ncbi:hypothetical protein FIU94_15005 [Sulfitobacter sp. THAF37]|uniref:hypothetical protein n=1 Tax=Sulfitobacter sp. THAF37 TaxID=2587855 RepID=UPI0012692389|nr:hypothetical protein [Sulfitobacter sp. THAF37]QFT60137.1 hypothetical protein FIU94_15005 [Sulfitobacter sp. THAF37]